MTHYFVTGTDTDVGKTLITSGFLIQSQQANQSCFGLKPIAAGAVSCPAAALQGITRWVNEDALILQQHSHPRFDYTVHNPWVFADPLSPHLAAQRHGISLTLPTLIQTCQACLDQAQAEINFIEGAGGWFVPFHTQHTLAELAQALGYPVILVVGMRLGCLNHALLTARAIQQSGLVLAGWVANQIDPQQQAAKENIDFLHQYFNTQGVACLGVVPHLKALTSLTLADQAAAYLTLP